MAEKKIEKSDWIIREGPEIKLGELSFGEMNPLSYMVGKRELELALVFTQHAVYVLDATESHLTIFDPLDCKPMILQLSWFAGTWRLATQVQVETTWLIAKSLQPQQSMMIEMTAKNYPWRAR